jgi:hypothetical protein
MVALPEVQAMTQDELLRDIHERLIRMDEQAKARDERLDRIEARQEKSDSTIERVRWWILGGVGAAGTMGGMAGDLVSAIK